MAVLFVVGYWVSNRAHYVFIYSFIVFLLNVCAYVGYWVIIFPNVSWYNMHKGHLINKRLTKMHSFIHTQELLCQEHPPFFDFRHWSRMYFDNCIGLNMGCIPVYGSCLPQLFPLNLSMETSPYFQNVSPHDKTQDTRHKTHELIAFGHVTWW